MPNSLFAKFKNLIGLGKKSNEPKKPRSIIGIVGTPPIAPMQTGGLPAVRSKRGRKPGQDKIASKDTRRKRKNKGKSGHGH